MNVTYVFAVFALICVVALIGLWKVFRVFNSPDGERYRRMKMQGPFAPLSAEDVVADEQSSRERRLRK
jgi:hypothetical protein